MDFMLGRIITNDKNEMMRKLCMCNHYSDKPMYRGPYDIYFGNEEDLNEDFDNARHTFCRIEGIDSFLYFPQDENIAEEIIIKKSYSKYWKEDIHSFVDNMLEDKKNVLFLYYVNRKNEIIYKIKIYDIEKSEVNYTSPGSLLDFELKISDFKQSYKFVEQKKKEK